MSITKYFFERGYYSRKKPCHTLKRPKKHDWRITVIDSPFCPPTQVFLTCRRCEWVTDEIDLQDLADLLPTDGTLFLENDYDPR